MILPDFNFYKNFFREIKKKKKSSKIICTFFRYLKKSQCASMISKSKVPKVSLEISQLEVCSGIVLLLHSVGKMHLAYVCSWFISAHLFSSTKHSCEAVSEGRRLCGSESISPFPNPKHMFALSTANRQPQLHQPLLFPHVCQRFCQGCLRDAATKEKKKGNNIKISKIQYKKTQGQVSISYPSKAYCHGSKVETFKIVILKGGDNFVSLCLSLIHLVYIWAWL